MSHYTRSNGERIALDAMNTHHLRAAAKGLHAANPAHPELAPMVAEIDRRDAEYYAEHPQDTKPSYPWERSH